MRLSARTKLLIVQIVSILPFLLLIFYLLDLWYDTKRLSALQRNSDNAKLIATIINHSFDIGLRTASMVAASPGLESILKTDLKLARETMQIIVSNNPELSAIAIFDLTGKTLTTTMDLPKEKLEQVNVSDRQYFQDVVKTKKSAVSSGIMDSKFRDAKIVVMAAPKIVNDQLVAVVASSYEMDFLQKTIKNIFPPNIEKTIILLDRDRNIALLLGNNVKLDDNIKFQLANESYITRAQRGEIATFENQKIPFLDKLVLGAAAQVDGYGWVVVSVEPVDTIFSPLLRVQSILWIVLPLALLFSIGLISYYLRKIRIIY